MGDGWSWASEDAPTNPWTDAAMAVELTLRERQALMTQQDWHPLIVKVLDADA